MTIDETTIADFVSAVRSRVQRDGKVPPEMRARFKDTKEQGRRLVLTVTCGAHITAFIAPDDFDYSDAQYVAGMIVQWVAERAAARHILRLLDGDALCSHPAGSAQGSQARS